MAWGALHLRYKNRLDRLTKGLRLVEILKQFSGSPINLMGQMGILSLANQNLIKGLAINSVQVFLHLYFELTRRIDSICAINVHL